MKIRDFPILKEAVEFASYDGGNITADVQALLDRELTEQEASEAAAIEARLQAASAEEQELFCASDMDQDDMDEFTPQMRADYEWVGTFCGY